MRSRADWLTERMTYIGGSDAPTVLGVNPFKSRYQLWAEKTGVAEPEDLSDKECVEFGNRFEQPVAEAFAARTGRQVDMWPAHTLVRDPDRNHVGCTPDSVQICPMRGEGNLQIKTTNQYNAGEWKDEPPLYVQVQFQQELHCTGFTWGSVAVCIGGQRLKYFDLERNDEFLAKLLPALDAFWLLVTNKTPPEVDGSEATAQLLKRLHADDNGETTSLPDEAASWTRTIEDCKAAIKSLKEEQQLAENKIKAAIGANTFGLLPDGRLWSWRTHDRKGYTVQPSVVRVLKMKGE